MLLLSGMLFLLQTCLLPGLLVLYFLRVRELSQILLLSMPVSLSFNYVIFHLLNQSDLGIRPVWFGIVAFEVILLIFIAWHHRRAKLIDLFRPDANRIVGWWHKVSKELQASRVVTYILILAALFSLSTFLFLVFYKPGFKTFSEADDIAHWAKWAKQWASLGQAQEIYWYPQMGPISRAIGLIFLGELEIHLFSKMAMPIFSLLMVAMMIDLETRIGNRRFLLAASILAILLWHYASSYLDSGHMDLPTATMLLASVYPFLSYSGKGFVKNSGLLAATVTSSVIAAGAVWTKQTGLFVLFAVFGIWLWSRFTLEREKRLPIWAPATVLLVAIMAAASFYIPQAIQVTQGNDVSNIATLRGLNWKDPWFNSEFLGAIYHYPIFSGIVLVGAFVVFKGKDKFFFFAPVLAVLGFLIWSKLFNYDIRNCFFIFPFLAISLASACAVIWKKFGGKLERNIVYFTKYITHKAINAPVIGYIAVISVFAGLAFVNIPDKIIYNRQKNANLEQLSLGIPNELVLGVADFIDPTAKIVVTYEHSALIPETRDRYVVGWIRADKKAGEGDWESAVRDQFLKFLVRPENRFLLTFNGYVEKFNMRAAELIVEAEKKKILRPLMSRYNTTLYYYDPEEMKKEFISNK